METFFVTLAPQEGGTGLPVLVSHSPPIHGAPLGYRTYRITAYSRDEAKKHAKDRWLLGDPSDPL